MDEPMDIIPERLVTIVGQGGVLTEIDLNQLGDDELADAIPDLLTDYSAECKDWTLFAGEHWRKGRWQRAQMLLEAGLRFFAGGPTRGPDPTALVNIHAMLAHLHLALARTAPKVIVPHAKYDRIAPGTKIKDHHYTEAAANLNRADQALQASGQFEEEPIALSMGKIILYLARSQPQAAQPLVEKLLMRQPNNLIALSAQARLQFARRAHDAAFQTYQKILTLNPEMSPDPRIGLGLCAWVLGDKEMARSAWQRALQRDPSSWTSLLLLGLASLNTAREPSQPRDERLRLETEGVSYVQRAFKLNNKCSASALALSTVSGQGGQLPLASKLAERSIQYADNRRHSVLANAERGRLGYLAGDVADASPFISAAKAEEVGGVNIMAEMTLGQIAIKNGNLREALNFIEQTASRLHGKGPIEYTVLHACLLAYPHPGMKEDELLRNRTTARTMLSEVHQLVSTAQTDEDWAKLRGIGTDADVFLDLARLWQDESLEKTIAAYETAVSMANEKEQDGVVDLRNLKLSSNLGAMFQAQGNVDTAERMYQEALQKLAGEEGKEAEVLKTELAYNLGRAYEEGGEVVKASQWYRDVLRQHPEHMESKVRLAMLSAAAGRNLDAHTLLKECLKSDESNLTLRTVYTHFLISLSSHKEALAFTTQTLKFDKSDISTYCALGWLHFTLAREAKTSSELAERTKQYLRSAEAYERALVLDPKCAVAAQGLAIALAEDTLQLGGAAGGVQDVKVKMKLAGQALGVFSRIADCLSEGSVSVNMGHCYFTRGEEDKAIQSYEAALNHYKGRNVSVLLYLARAWYAYANKESNFSAMSKALLYCQKAMHIQPSDRAILYNIAMIQQKAAEMLFALEPAKRTLEELKSALTRAQQAANTFRTLADDKSGQLPYDADLADQRARYGDGVLRRAPEQISKQEAFEAETHARVEEARRARAEEQARIQAAEDARRAELEAKAAQLAEQRRLAQEEAAKWQEELNLRQAEEEERKAQIAERRKRKKEGGEVLSEDEGGEKKVKKRRGGGKKSRKIRSKSEVGSEEEEEEEARGGDSEDDERVGEAGEEVDEEEVKREKKAAALAKLKAKSKTRRTVVDPDEDDDTPVTTRKGGKQFKSKEYIEDSDDDSDDSERKDSTAPVTAAASENGMDVDGEDGSVPREAVPTGAPGVEAYADEDGE